MTLCATDTFRDGQKWNPGFPLACPHDREAHGCENRRVKNCEELRSNNLREAKAASLSLRDRVRLFLVARAVHGSGG